MDPTSFVSLRDLRHWNEIRRGGTGLQLLTAFAVHATD
jgi:hypothetical protein